MTALVKRLRKLSVDGRGWDKARPLLAEAADEIERLHKLNERLHVVAKNVSHALMSFTPGGSEYFTRVQVGDFEDYYADADACQRRVRERITRAEDRAARRIDGDAT